MEKQITAFSNLLTKKGVENNIWKDRRIYMATDRTAKAYIEFDNPESIEYEGLFSGCALKVYSSCESQTTKWNINQAKQIKHGFMQKLGSILSFEVCENWEDVIL